MKSLHDLRMTLHRRHLLTLNIYRFVEQSAFQQAYKLANETEKEDVMKHIEKSDLPNLTYWTKCILKAHRQYEFLDVRYLRELVQDLGVRNYSIMTRLELVSMLQNGVKNVQKVGS